jgi:phenylalanyl-tRNA synthetase beta subunit
MLVVVLMLTSNLPAPAVYPDLSPRTLDVSVSTINQGLGLALTTEQLVELLKGMQLSAGPNNSSSSSEAGSIALHVPPTRSDILHACDVVEDVAIAYGYNNVPKRVRSTSGVGLRALPGQPELGQGLHRGCLNS